MGFWSAFAEHYERVFPPRPVAVAWLAGLATGHGAPAASCALDLGCGTGADSAGLSAAGLDVLALDPDAAMIDVARTRYDGAPRLCFEVAGLADFVPPLKRWAASSERCEDAGLDLAVCLGNVAAHLTEDELGAFLVELRPRLNAGGTLVLQTVNFDRILATAAGSGRFDFPVLEDPAREGLPALRFERRYEALGEGGCEFHVRLLADRELVFEGQTSLFPHRAATIDGLARAAEFRTIERHGAFGPEPFDPAASGPAVAVLRS